MTMAGAALLEQARNEAWSDEQVVSRVLVGETALYELLMRRYNQRLYRVAKAILRDDAEAEDVMQDAYVRAYQHLADFEGRAKFSTWLTRIAVHEALARSRRHSRFQSLDNEEESKGRVMRSLASAGRNPEEAAYDRELGGVLEQGAASNPFMTGMERSSTINSGRSCWAFSIASFPFSASPHTARSASRWKRSQSTLRIHGLSSTIRTDLQEWECGVLMSCLLWLP